VGAREPELLLSRDQPHFCLLLTCSIDNDEELNLPGERAQELFDMWVNTCPAQGSRTIRTEEAILLSVSRLWPSIRASGQKEPFVESAP
jgi:predicted SPOUT superfamily RNA methylase MTH1